MDEEINADDIVSKVKTVTEICSQKIPENWIKDLDLEKKKKVKPDLKYVPIDKCIRFLNENFKDRWDCIITKSETYMIGELLAVSKDVELRIYNRRGTQDFISRPGTGGDIALEYWKDGKRMVKTDVDKINKTAFANAIKKSLNMFGFALELWDEDNLPDSEKNKEVDNYKAKVDTCLKVLGWTEVNLNTYIKSWTGGKVETWDGLNNQNKKKLAENLAVKCKNERETEVK